MKLDGETLRRYMTQVARQIDEYADRIDELEEQATDYDDLQAEITRLIRVNNDQCDEIYELQLLVKNLAEHELKAATP